MIARSDDEGLVGLSIGMEMVDVAARALRLNLARLAPLIMPISQKLVVIGSILSRKVTSALQTGWTACVESACYPLISPICRLGLADIVGHAQISSDFGALQHERAYSPGSL